jgi:hypothetical protein
MERIQAEIPARDSRARERGEGILDPQPASVWDTKHLAHRRQAPKPAGPPAGALTRRHKPSTTSFARSAANPTHPLATGRRCTSNRHGAAARIGWKGTRRGCRCFRASLNWIPPRSSSVWSRSGLKANWPTETNPNVCRHYRHKNDNLIPLGYGTRPRIWVHLNCAEPYRAELKRRALAALGLASRVV